MRSITLTPAAPVFADAARTSADAVAGVQRIAGQLFQTLVLWQRRHEERRRMAHLDPRLIADAGLTADAIARETAKPFWQA